MSNGFDSNEVPASSCVARLHSPAERLQYLRRSLRDESDPLVALTHLLHLCRDEHHLLWDQLTDPHLRAMTRPALRRLHAIAGSRPAQAELDQPLRAAMADALIAGGDVAPVVIAHALAEFLDSHYKTGLAASFQRRSPYQPAVGDPIPLGVPDIREVIEMRPTSPPWRLANRLDETRHVRLAGAWATRFRIVFDYSAFDALAGVVTADTIIATCHPNRDLNEFRLPADRTRPAFPVGPNDMTRQELLIDGHVRDAVFAGASIVVLPELCATESLSYRLEDWVRRDGGPKLLIAGSFHHREHSAGRRANTSIAWLRGHSRPLIHDKLSPAEHPIAEDIQPQGWPEWRIYVSSDGWHLVMAICRDLLNPEAVHALTEAGANLILVPAMSETLGPFTGQIGHLVSSSQALVAVANNPADWSDSTGVQRPARALFGHPGLGQQVRLVTPPDSGPGIAAMHVRSAKITWSGTADGAMLAAGSADSPPSQTDRIQWLQALAVTLRARYQQSGGRRAPGADAISLRRAAVLVLLTDGLHGLQVLLTERASDLRDYPGRLTFPGGACDFDDIDIVGTALREAEEEIGLDPASVQVVGSLPPIGDPEMRFLVTPVLGYSARPRYHAPTNLAEVAAVRVVDLWRISQLNVSDPSNSPTPPLGTMTSTVIDLVVALLHDHCSLHQGGPAAETD